MKETNQILKTDKMAESGVHYAYSKSRRHPKMTPFIFTVRNNTEIFNLDKIQDKLEIAKTFVREIGVLGKIILFVGTKEEVKSLIEKYASEIGMPFVSERWLGGTLTNFNEIKGRINWLNKLTEEKQKGEFGKYVKKERFQLEKQIEKLEKYLSGIKSLQDYPSVLVVVDAKEEKIAIEEARKMNIPVVALMNSDCDISDADYPIPGNDSAVTSIDYFLSEIIKAYKN